MTTPAYSSVRTKVLSIDDIVHFFLYFFSFIIDNGNYESLFRKCLKMKTFLLFTIIYSEINIYDINTISPRQ